MRLDSPGPAARHGRRQLQLPPPHAGPTQHGKKESSCQGRPQNGRTVEPGKTLAGLGRARRVRLDRLLTCTRERLRRFGRPGLDPREPFVPRSGLGQRSNSLSRRSKAASISRSVGWSRASPTTIHGLDPRGYHLVSLLFHVVNVVLLHLLCVRLLARQMPEVAERLGAALWLALRHSGGPVRRPSPPG